MGQSFVPQDDSLIRHHGRYGAAKRNFGFAENELWGTQGVVRDAVRAVEAEWRGLDPEAPLLPPMDRGMEFFGTRAVMCACVERSLERRGVEPFLVRMEVQSIIRYVACLERDGEEWCAYHFPFMPEDVDPRTRPHLVRLAEREGL